MFEPIDHQESLLIAIEGSEPQEKPIWPAIAILSTLATISVFLVGLNGYLQVGDLKDLTFEVSVILMGSGVVSTIVLLSAGIWGFCRDHENQNPDTSIKPEIKQNIPENSKITDAEILERAKSYTKKEIEQMPKASSGQKQASIRMPEDLPVVIRSSYKDIIHKKQMLHEHCQQQYKHVVAPKAIIHNDMMIEKRLPNENGDSLRGMAFYYQKRESFTPAIMEFIDFLSVYRLDDVLGGDDDIFNYLEFEDPENKQFVVKSFAPRFDNLLLYEEEQDGEMVCKIGVIDLDTLQRRHSQHLKEDEVFSILFMTICLFPFHSEEIIQEGKSKFNISNETATQLKSKTFANQQLYQILCEEHFKFFEKKNITCENPPLAQIDLEKEQAILEHISDFLHKEASAIAPQSLNEIDLEWHKLNVESARELLEDSNRSLSDLIHQMLIFTIDQLNVLANAGESCTSYVELIEKRSYFGELASELATKWEAQSDSPHICEIFEKILKHLAMFGKISYYKEKVSGEQSITLF
jgi:hypothetical protein